MRIFPALAVSLLLLSPSLFAQEYSNGTHRGKPIVCEEKANGKISSGSQSKRGKFRSDAKRKKRFKARFKQLAAQYGKKSPQAKKMKKKLALLKSRAKYCREHVAEQRAGAKGILQNYCANCHLDQHSSWISLSSDADWLAASTANGSKLISPGDPDNSPLVSRISFYGASNSNMPLPNNNQENDLSEDQYQVIRDWISSLEQSNYDPSLSCESQSGLLLPKLRRLSQLQIQNSITDVFGNLFESSIWPAMEDSIRLVGMNNMADSLAVNDINFERVYDASRSIVTTVIRDNSALAECAAGSSDSCVLPLFEQYARRLWRRPVSTTEVSDIAIELAKFSNNQDKLEVALNSILLSSNFLYRSEIGSVEGNAKSLSNYELISILSFALWNSVPDEALLDLAAQSEPLSAEQIRSQVDRMLQDGRAKAALVEMYKDYLKLELIYTREKSSAYGFNSSVRDDLLGSAELMIGDSIDSASTFMEVFEGSNFYVNANTAPFFNVSVSGTSQSLISIDESQRDGLLNHPAFLSVHSTLDSSGIVKRGVFTLEQVLCEEIPDPPADISGVDPPEGLDPDTTSERDLLEITHSAQAACRGCHASIDPAGFGYENFDAVGRYRETEKQNVPIDASGTLDTVGSVVLSYSNSAEYSRVLTASPQMNDCVSLRFLEHFFGQILSLNSCEVRKFQERLRSNGNSVNDLIYNFVLAESFSKRANQ